MCKAIVAAIGSAREAVKLGTRLIEQGDII